MSPESVLLYGSERPLPRQQPLRAGPLSLVYEEGDLRYIRLGEREILRRVYVAVRDRNWDTVPAELSHVQIRPGDDSFEIQYVARHRQNEIDFVWHGMISGDERGTIRFTMDGEARSAFLRNRIGFCVLHPERECAGQPCVVEKADGTMEEGAFPRYVSPHQPFKEMRAITQDVARGVRARVLFEGDVFEMEDQRNWTDASFKTYCTPLARPYPVEVRQGERIAQAITLTLEGSPTAPAALVGDRPLTIGPAEGPPIPLPAIGLGVASHGQPLSSRELERLGALRLKHLRVDLRLADSRHPHALRQAAVEARELGIPLEIALHLTDRAEEELNGLQALLREVRPSVGRWLIFHSAEKSTSENWLHLARQALSRFDPAAKIGAGTDAYFTELNRGRPPVAAADLIAYALNPQVHAFDNASLVETLAAQATTVESARQFTGGRSLAVTPVTLRPRFNPNATGPEREPGPGELPSPVDARQMSLFGAVWTLGSLKYLAESGVESVTYYETTGWRGVMETEAGAPLPNLFRSVPGGVYPLFHVLADVGEFAGGEVVPTRSEDALRAESLLLRQGLRARLLVANMTPSEQAVEVPVWRGPARARRLNTTTVEEAVRAPEVFRRREELLLPGPAGELVINLSPYALVRLDGEGAV